MLEINCQHWTDNYDLSDFSDSIANSGDRNIGRHTWENALKAILDGYKSKDKLQMIVTSTVTRRQVISYFEDFGAWSYSELNSMSNTELSALSLQYIAGNYKEDMGNDDDLDSDDYESGHFYRRGEDIWANLSH